MNHAVFGINDARHGNGDGGQTFQFLLMADKELVDMLNNTRQERLFMLERQLELLLNHQLAAEIA